MNLSEDQIPFLFLTLTIVIVYGTLLIIYLKRFRLFKKRSNNRISKVQNEYEKFNRILDRLKTLSNENNDDDDNRSESTW